MKIVENRVGKLWLEMVLYTSNFDLSICVSGYSLIFLFVFFSYYNYNN